MLLYVGVRWLKCLLNINFSLSLLGRRIVCLHIVLRRRIALRYPRIEGKIIRFYFARIEISICMASEIKWICLGWDTIIFSKLSEHLSLDSLKARFYCRWSWVFQTRLTFRLFDVCKGWLHTCMHTTIFF